MKIIDFLKTLPHVETDADYLNAIDYYPYLNSLARDFKAGRVLEVGVRFGYSAVAFIYGNPIKEYVGIDDELYDATSSTKSRVNLEYLKSIQPVEYTLIKQNTQELNDLSFLSSKVFDLIHIDGDHSYEGALTDLKNFWNVLAIGGHMLVDDSIFYASVNTACIDFAGLIDEPGYNVKTFRGTWVFLKTRERRFAISKSVVNEMTSSTPINEADVFKTFNATHAGWSGRVVLLNDGSFRGGLHNPDGQWKRAGEVLKLEWYHWPESVLRANGAGTYVSIIASDSLTLAEVPPEEDEQHLGGNVPGGDALTFYPELWRWLVERFSVRTVLDIGCGEGHALAEFEKDGARAIGIEGHKANVSEAVNKGLKCILHDFTKGVAPLLEEFDLGWCCEFVEHVEEQFVENILTAFRQCRIIAMTHAQPGQGGHHHVNCQPANYWIDKLARIGFSLLPQETESARKFYPNTYWAWTGMIFERNSQ